MDREPNEAKRPPECPREGSILRCPHIRETGGGFEGEQYHCDICGAAVYLNYGDMR